MDWGVQDHAHEEVRGERRIGDVEHAGRSLRRDDPGQAVARALGRQLVDQGRKLREAVGLGHDHPVERKHVGRECQRQQPLAEIEQPLVHRGTGEFAAYQARRRSTTRSAMAEKRPALSPNFA